MIEIFNPEITERTFNQLLEQSYKSKTQKELQTLLTEIETQLKNASEDQKQTLQHAKTIPTTKLLLQKIKKRKL